LPEGTRAVVGRRGEALAALDLGRELALEPGELLGAPFALLERALEPPFAAAGKREGARELKAGRVLRKRMPDPDRPERPAPDARSRADRRLIPRDRKRGHAEVLHPGQIESERGGRNAGETLRTGGLFEVLHGG